MTPPAPACQVCAEPALDEVTGFKTLNRVTSDCKPWPAGGQMFICTACGMVQKQATSEWRAEISRIYENYILYPQGKGAEQAVFDSTGHATASRSVAIVAGLAEATPLPESGRLLDIGCGNGAFLNAFARQHPGWALHGSELDERNFTALNAIPGFKKLHTGELSEIGEKFDLISMIHALEHIENPAQFLMQVRQILSTPEAPVVIEVPDWGANPFDLLITDHLLHFAMPTLQILLKRAGLSPISIVNDWIAKEISVVARPHNSDGRTQGPVGTDPHHTRAELEEHLQWHDRLVNQAKELCDNAGDKIGIFGTSIAATWLFGAIEERVGFFIDEDPHRVGGNLFGHPILAPADVPLNAAVFVPLPTKTADPIAHRLGGENGSRYTTPETVTPR